MRLRGLQLCEVRKNLRITFLLFLKTLWLLIATLPVKYTKSLQKPRDTQPCKAKN